MDLSQSEGAKKLRRHFDSDLVVLTMEVGAVFMPDPTPDESTPLFMIRVGGPEYDSETTEDSPSYRVAFTLMPGEAATFATRLANLLNDNGYGELLLDASLRELITRARD